MTDLSYAYRYPDRCDEYVVRQGCRQRCDAVAVAVRVDPQGDPGYPVCVRHVRGDMVPLGELVNRFAWELRRVATADVRGDLAPVA